jgi:hypothetical protein
LDEAEVSEQVSSIKKDRSGPAYSEPEDDRLGLENASFKWNEVEEAAVAKDDKDKNGKKAASDADSILTAETETTVADHKFELKDISVIFPDGELTLVTGPTARFVRLPVI